jgi:hypothetical protein
VRLTVRVIAVALIAIASTAVLWPDAGEAVIRTATLAAGAALVADLVLLVTRALPASPRPPFAPPRLAPTPPWCPQGLTELARDLALMDVAGDARRLPLAARLRTTCRAGAQARLAPLGLDLDRPDDGPAVTLVLGTGPYAFLTGAARTVDPDELLAAVAPDSDTLAADRSRP